MHLLEHGIIPAIIEILEAVFLDHKMGKAFERFANSHLDDIPHLRIDWSKVKRVPRANWLAEDGFGYCRIMFFMEIFLRVKLEQTQTYSLLRATLQHLKKLLSSCHVMVCHIMSRKKIDTRILDVYIKIFLSCCHHFSTAYYDATVTTFWFSKGNAVSLLRLPHLISENGLPSFYWDGYFERFIQPPKRILVPARKSPASLRTRMKVSNAEGSFY